MLVRLQSLLRLLFVWKKDLSHDLPHPWDVRPDCLIMLAFGQAYQPVGLGAGLETSRLIPGEPNETIARALVYAGRDFGYGDDLPPILAQWEFAETRVFATGGWRHPKIGAVLGLPDEYRNTREIIMEAKTMMDKRGWKTALIVAHPWHLARCQWTAQKLGIVVVHDLNLANDLNDTLDPIWNSRVQVPENQTQTTSLGAWLWYEFRARGYFWLKGWI